MIEVLQKLLNKSNNKSINKKLKNNNKSENRFNIKIRKSEKNIAKEKYKKIQEKNKVHIKLKQVIIMKILVIVDIQLVY